MPDLPETLRLTYHAERAHPRDVPLRDVYLDLDFPPGVGDRPFVYVNMVQTFDGQAVLKGTAYTIGTDVDHYLLRQLRVHADAVLCGAGTLRNDDVIIVTHPQLQERRVRAGKPPNPLAIVATAAAEFRDEVFSSKKFFKRKDLDRLIVTTSRASDRAVARIRDARVAVEVVDATSDGEVDLPRLLRRLRTKGIHILLCEGGPTLNASLAKARALDHLFVTNTLRLGGEGDEPRIFSEPVTDQPLTLISEYQFIGPQGPKELYFSFQFPRS